MISGQVSFLSTAYTAVIVLFTQRYPFRFGVVFDKSALYGASFPALEKASDSFSNNKTLIGRRSLSFLSILSIAVFWVIAPTIFASISDKFSLSFLLGTSSPVSEIFRSFFLVFIFPFFSVLSITIFAPRSKTVIIAFIFSEAINSFFRITSYTKFSRHAITLKRCKPHHVAQLLRPHRCDRACV